MRHLKTFNGSQLNIGDHTLQVALSLSPTPSAPLGQRRPARRGSAEGEGRGCYTPALKLSRPTPPDRDTHKQFSSDGWMSANSVAPGEVWSATVNCAPTAPNPQEPSCASPPLSAKAGLAAGITAITTIANSAVSRLRIALPSPLARASKKLSLGSSVIASHLLSRVFLLERDAQGLWNAKLG